MRKSAGFTLIELVIVIVILGILGAVAAPRFLNLQGDAYEANVKALNGSIRSAMTLANTKAILDGYDKGSKNGEGELSNVAFVEGFPAATDTGIINMLQDVDSFSADADADSDSSYIIGAGSVANTLIIAPRARGLNANCQIIYSEAEAANTTSGSEAPYKPAKTEIDVSGC